MSWCNRSCRYVMTQNALVQTQFIQKFPLFSKQGFHNAWNQSIFKLNLLFMKSHLPFDLRLSKNWWSLLENLWMRHLLEIWWSDSKDLFSQFGQAKRWHVSKAFSGKDEFFENQASWQDSFLLFLNMAIWQTSRPTVIDSRIRRKAFWNKEFKFWFREG